MVVPSERRKERKKERKTSPHLSFLHPPSCHKTACKMGDSTKKPKRQETTTTVAGPLELRERDKHDFWVLNRLPKGGIQIGHFCAHGLSRNPMDSPPPAIGCKLSTKAQKRRGNIQLPTFLRFQHQSSQVPKQEGVYIFKAKEELWKFKYFTMKKL